MALLLDFDRAVFVYLLSTWLLSLDVLAFSIADSSSQTATKLVSVAVQRTLNVSPAKAQQVWLSQIFEEGGGLPILVFPQNDATRLRRVILPLFAQETILSPTFGDDQQEPYERRIEYQLTGLGPMWRSEIERNSHLGIVKFQRIPGEGEDCCSMTWTSTYSTLQRQRLWERVTELTLNAASDHLMATLATPQLYARITKLSGSETTTPQELVEEWIQFSFLKGGGLPLNPPWIVNPGNAQNVWEGTELLRIPPFLRERIVSVDCSNDDCCEVCYKVVNPSLFTYQVHSHLGRVRFIRDGDNGITMVWNVEIRPYQGWESIVKVFTEAVVTTLARNFATHVAEPHAQVSLRPPRGGDAHQQALAQVSKDSWWGGVLDAHLKDQRSTWEQTMAIFQPWTWGRSTDGEGEGAKWTTEYMD